MAKSTQMNVKMSEEEKLEIEEMAKEVNMTVSEYMRFTSINAEITVVVKKKH